ncbi:MAG: ParB/RepB/Spo0J family partition protein [Chloroflexi bacterium]|nr:ParB/RepB/Spo0J family partition protein [Chloroflexota bacterium]
MANNKRKINTSPLDSIGLDMDFLTADPAERLDDDSLKIHYLSAQLIRPDAAQPRRVLPERIYWEFHGERLTPAQALREFIQDVQIIARQKGRPFNTILDLLPNPDSEEEETVNFTPEETLLRDLINLAVTIRDDGQVNPLTVVDCSQGVTQLFRIETGERRYWATWLLMDFLPGYQGDGTIPCIIVPAKRASVFRQAKENTSRTGLNAIAMARQAALLILAVHGIHPPENGPINNDFYRQALEHDLRGKREFTADILAAMGGIHKVRLRQYKALLGLSDEATEMADRHAIDEGKLRPLLSVPSEHHAEIVRQIVDFKLTTNQVREMCSQPSDNNDDVQPYKPPRYAVKFAKSVLKGDSAEMRAFIEALVFEEDNPEVVKVRLKQFLAVTEEYLTDL